MKNLFYKFCLLFLLMGIPQTTEANGEHAPLALEERVSVSSVAARPTPLERDESLPFSPPKSYLHSPRSGFSLGRFILFLMTLWVTVTGGQDIGALTFATGNSTALNFSSSPDLLVEVPLSPTPESPSFRITRDHNSLEESDDTSTSPLRVMAAQERREIYEDLDRAYWAVDDCSLTSCQEIIKSWKTLAHPSFKAKNIPLGPDTTVVKQFHYAVSNTGVLVTVDLTKCVGLALYNPIAVRGGLGHVAGETVKDLDQYLRGTQDSPHSLQKFVGEVAQETPLSHLQATLVSGHRSHINYFKRFLEVLGIRNFVIVYNENWVSAGNNQFNNPTGNIALNCATGSTYGVSNIRAVYQEQGPSGFSSNGGALPFKKQGPSSKSPNKKKQKNERRRGKWRGNHH